MIVEAEPQPGVALVRYEAARSALAECQRVDEVKDIRDRAEALAAYARQAKDSALIEWATEIKVRAERRAGEMLQQTDRARPVDNLRHVSKSNDATSMPTLDDIGITRDQSSRWQRLAAIPPEHFEAAVETAKASAGEVTTAFMLREARALLHGTPDKPAASPRPTPAPQPRQLTVDELRAELQEYRNWHAEMRRITGQIGRDEITRYVAELVRRNTATGFAPR